METSRDRRLVSQSFQSAKSRQCVIYVPVLLARNWGIRKTRVNRVLRGFHADLKQGGIKFKDGGSIQLSPVNFGYFRTPEEVQGPQFWLDDSAASMDIQPPRLVLWFIGTWVGRDRYQFGQSILGCVCRGASLTKHCSQTRVPFLSVKSTLRVGSMSAPHFPQSSVCALLISTLDHQR